ncbi:hypothetical protein CHS0354_025732 [Potamilus streckersoni]|uniref:Mab-21-like HhH/H2TH-like domain-containing protein n=1 Tax=Potamilus streckersoni TaxID=2493646 RepID=A0AAE0VUC6_9BIVA|nr:hypothetical protein CHS0354_025732 [Potamilus streckersoni]
MEQQVPDYYAQISERLANILDNVGYSQADRQRKVRVATDAEILLNLTSLFSQSIRQSSPYICGSRSEGSTGPGLCSDIDLLLSDNIFKVVTDQFGCQPDKINYLILTDAHTHPGYVKLQRVMSRDYTSASLIPDVCVPCRRDSCGRTEEVNLIPNNVHNVGTIINSILFPINKVNAGPAQHYRHSLKLYSSNWVYVYRCFDWPREGAEWVSRPRRHGWPTAQQIENVRKHGCFTTPIGHRGSDEQHLEWRLSFSLAERDLTRSFEDTVMKVYVLLKMIKKTFIEPHLGDAFSSYHCKVCMLWMREQSPPELWRTENLLYCLTLCIRKLLEFVTMGYCPDYFVAENNTYDTKVVGATRFKLQMLLRCLLSQDCRFLLAVECCDIGQQLAGGLMRIENEWLILEEVTLDHVIFIGAACECRTHMMRKPLQSLINSVPSYTLIQAYRCLQVPLCYIRMIICEKLGFHIASICKANAEKNCSQECIDDLVCLASELLTIGINIDATSVRLKLCAMGVVLKAYDQTEICLHHISDHCMKYIYSCTGFEFMGPRVLNCSLISLMENTEIYSSLELLQNQSSFVVIYQPSEIYIAPVPLRMEMFRSLVAPPILKYFWYEWAVVDSLFCLHFLQFLNFSRQGKIQNKQVAISNMIHVIRTEPDIPHRDTALNLLGYCFLLENEPQKAFVCFSKSLQILPYHNASKFYLGLLLQKVNATQKIRMNFHR